jgi:triacylglycerol esterase/lipase EstA (alpha/beta hydrolase family)
MKLPAETAPHVPHHLGGIVLTYYQRVHPTPIENVVFLNTLRNLVSQLINDGELRRPLREL